MNQELTFCVLLGDEEKSIGRSSFFIRMISAELPIFSLTPIHLGFLQVLAMFFPLISLLNDVSSRQNCK